MKNKTHLLLFSFCLLIFMGYGLCATPDPTRKKPLDLLPHSFVLVLQNKATPKPEKISVSITKIHDPNQCLILMKGIRNTVIESGKAYLLPFILNPHKPGCKPRNGLLFFDKKEAYPEAKLNIPLLVEKTPFNFENPHKNVLRLTDLSPQNRKNAEAWLKKALQTGRIQNSRTNGWYMG